MRAPAEKVSIRQATPDDLKALGQIWLELMSFHERSDGRFALAHDGLSRWRSLAYEMVYRDDGFLFMAEIDGRPVGFCLGWVARNPPIYRVTDVGFISEIAIARSARRRGIGTMLVHSAREWFEQRGLEEYQLSTAVWNETAQAFWKALGGAPLLVRYRFSIGQEHE